MRWDTDDAIHRSSVKLSGDLKFEIVRHFRHLQRCRVESEWPEFKAGFLERVKDSIMKQDASPTSKVSSRTKKSKGLTTESKIQQFESVKAYFEKNWFIDMWIGKSLSACLVRPC